MFKGLSLNRRHRTLLGRNLPLYNLADFSWEFYQPTIRLNEVWQRAALERWETRYPKRLREDYGQHQLAVEDLRLRPLSREPDASGRLCLWRTQPWDPFMSDTDILSVYDRLSAPMKLNGIVYGKAVGRVIGRAGRRVPNNNFGTPVDASEMSRALWFLAAVFKRKLRRVFERHDGSSRLASSGSWPNWHYYVRHSAVIAEQWSKPSDAERDLFTSILGIDPWQTPLSEWATNKPLILLRLLSARIWLRQHNVIAR